MVGLSHDELTTLFLALAVLLAAARALGELARRFNQPAVLGELMAGVLLGPTVFGAIAPGLSESLFPQTGGVPIALDGLTQLAIALFLLVAGMEVDLSTVWRQGKAALTIGSVGMVVPFAIGFGPAFFAPELMGRDEDADRLVFALFMATAFSITALPLIAKILMDLNLFRTDLGMTVVAAAIFNDLVGWIIFAIVLAMIGQSAGMDLGVGMTIVLTIGFAAFMLTLGRTLIDRSLPWIQAHTSWPGGVLGFALSLALLSAAFTEWIGVHAIFGAFLLGVAIGDSRHLRERTRSTLDQFISFIFAPLFFASIGLKVNFIESFDPVLVTLVLLIAVVGKLLGGTIAAKWSGFNRRESWAVGFAMNARGAMEIILGLIALEAGLIGDELFVALVIMALVTSVTSGTLMQRCLGLKKPADFSHYITPKTFVGLLSATDRAGAIDELATAVGEAHEALEPEAIAKSVQSRERLFSSGIGNGVAVPHARMPELEEPVVAVGFSRGGVDFDARDGRPAKLIVLLLTPYEDTQQQLELLASIARTFQDEAMVAKAVQTKGQTEFLALIRSEAAPDGH